MTDRRQSTDGRRRLRRALAPLALVLAGCASTAELLVENAVLPEQRTLDVRDPGQLPPAGVPALPSPRTVSDPQPETKEYQLTLDEAVRVALVNAKVIRVLAGTGAVSSGRTIYDPAVSNTVIDQEQARFDPAVTRRNRFTHLDTPQAVPDLFNPLATIVTGTQSDDYRGEVGLSKTNVLGGQALFTWVENPTKIDVDNLALNPSNRSFVEFTYTQPLLQGGGFLVNTAPIVIARLDTERSFYANKDAVQELVRGVIEAYWNLVSSRVDVWATRIQVEQSKENFDREVARKQTGFGDLKTVSQARLLYNQFRSSLVAAEAAVLANEGALRNIMGLPPEDGRALVPVSAPASNRLVPDWKAVLRLADERRPDVIDIKLLLQQDRELLIQAENLALPQLNATATYRSNALGGKAPNGEGSESFKGQFTDWSVGLDLSVPLGLRQGRAAARRQTLIIARDRANLEQVLHAAVHQLAVTTRELANTYEQYLALRETREAARVNLQAQTADYLAGRNIYLNVLTALQDWGNAVSAEARALLTYNVLLATLERQTGTILETHGLVFHEESAAFPGPLGVKRPVPYPAAVVPGGAPLRYPSSGEPGENSFELRNPAPHDQLRPPPLDKGPAVPDNQPDGK